MLKSKKKGLFVDFSEFSILAARTTSLKPPFQIEAIGEIAKTSDLSAADLFENLYDFGGNRYAQAVCGVYPPNRFVHVHEFESGAKARDPKNSEAALKTKYGIDPALASVEILSAETGEGYSFTPTTEKRFAFCGAPQSELQEAQDELVKLGVYPVRMSLGTISTVGALLDYAVATGINGPILFFEIRSHGANICILNKGGIEDSRMISSGLDSIFPLLQTELGLKDESSARRIFYSNTFDFAEMGPKLLRNVLRELQASIGSYEVKTGLMIEHLFVSLLPKNLNWINRTLSASLGVNRLQIEYIPWLSSLGITVGDAVDLSNLGSRWFGLFSLMADLQPRDATTINSSETTITNETSEQSEQERNQAEVAN